MRSTRSSHFYLIGSVYAAYLKQRREVMCAFIVVLVVPSTFVLQAVILSNKNCKDPVEGTGFQSNK